MNNLALSLQYLIFYTYFLALTINLNLYEVEVNDSWTPLGGKLQKYHSKSTLHARNYEIKCPDSFHLLPTPVVSLIANLIVVGLCFAPGVRIFLTLRREEKQLRVAIKVILDKQPNNMKILTSTNHITALPPELKLPRDMSLDCQQELRPYHSR